MTRANRAATAAKFSSNAAPPPAAAEPEPVDEQLDDLDAPPTAATKRVRNSLDLWPAHYRALKRWCDDAADALGVSKLDKQDALETLVRRLLTDETLSRKIIADLRAKIVADRPGRK